MMIKLLFFGKDQSKLYGVKIFSSQKEAEHFLENEILTKRIIKIPFELSKEAWEQFSEVVPLLDKSEIKNPKFEVKKITMNYK